MCLIIAAIGLIAALINMATAMQRSFSGKMQSVFVIHIIAAGMYIIGGLAAIGFGIAWIVTYLKP